MSELVKIVEKKPIPSDAIVIQGLPDVGLVGLIATAHIVFPTQPTTKQAPSVLRIVRLEKWKPSSRQKVTLFKIKTTELTV